MTFSPHSSSLTAEQESTGKAKGTSFVVKDFVPHALAQKQEVHPNRITTWKQELKGER